jgi:hypothetical protein
MLKILFLALTAVVQGVWKDYLILYIIIVKSYFWLQVLKMTEGLGKEFPITHHTCQSIPLNHLDHHLDHRLDHHLDHHLDTQLDHHLMHLRTPLNHLCKPQGRHLEDLPQRIRRQNQRNRTRSLANLIHVILLTMPFLLLGGRCLSSKDGWGSYIDEVHTEFQKNR